MFEILWLIFLCVVPLEAFKYAWSPRQSNYCKGHDFGEFVANPEDCKLFFLCGENGDTVLATCPPNMLFNPQTKLCDNPSNVQCETVEATSKPAVVASTPPNSPAIINTDNVPPRVDNYCFNYAKQADSYPLVFIPHPNNCQQYYMCYHGQALLQACSPKLHWNSKLNKCALPSQGDCFVYEGNEENVEVLPSLDEPIWGNGIKCPSYGEHIFPNTKRCDSFIYCVKGQAVLQVCPFYEFFDVDSGCCKLRSQATCVKDINSRYRKTNF